MDQKKAYSYSIRLLTKRDYSKFKLIQKMCDKGASESDAHEVIKELLEKNFLREEDYRDSRIRGLLRKFVPFKSIQYKLREEKIDTSIDFIEAVGKELSITELDIAKKHIQRMFLRSNTHLEEIKIYQRLRSKGIDHDIAKQAISSIS